MANIERGGLAFPCRVPVYMWLYMVWLCRHHDRSRRQLCIFTSWSRELSSSQNQNFHHSSLAVPFPCCKFASYPARVRPLYARTMAMAWFHIPEHWLQQGINKMYGGIGAPGRNGLAFPCRTPGPRYVVIWSGYIPAPQPVRVLFLHLRKWIAYDVRSRIEFFRMDWVPSLSCAAYSCLILFARKCTTGAHRLKEQG